ncbi:MULTISPECIES: hypothetical protein [unclassified Imperialibacter]|uniref:hypothetical protein n=1 Tax=unclassified Imperialibacter TaxID=2629706 RepID=UPI00125F5F00|nr:MULTISPECIES: hypothetical protein [unclassified Imperialibacter]CAD5299447.1 hypothetical protein IMPERIA75_80007 [Imperialibacter sp. 75]
MKNYLMLVLMGLVFVSCHVDDDFAEIEIEEIDTEFRIRDINGELVKALPVDLLKSIEIDLIGKGKLAKASQVFKLYDASTGQLNSAYLPKGESNGRMNDTQYGPNDVFGYCHQQDYGDIGPFSQAEYLGVEQPTQYVGHTGQSKKLEGMWLTTSAALVPTRPAVYYALRYGDLTWSANATWGQFTGTRGQSKATIGLKIWSTNPSFSTWYKAHNATVGWNQPWKSDGQFSGVTNKRMEAFAFYILQY